jgi:hypothetical protein
MRYFLAIFALLIPLNATALELSTPVECDMGKDCHIFNYVDTDASDKYYDYNCGTSTYEGHKGVDFRTNDIKTPTQDVNVVAAEKGTVVRLREGVADVNANAKDAADIEGIECGNGVVVAHVGGWETMYCHMAKGSITVKKGQRVKAGSVLGKIGMSGKAEIPHLHFSLRHQGDTIDPFTGLKLGEGCDDKPEKSLWSKKAQKQLPYTERTFAVASGFIDKMPTSEEIYAGIEAPETMPNTAETLIFWVYMFGIQEGDSSTIVLTGPEGKDLISDVKYFKKTRAKQWVAVGKKAPKGGWKAGEYKAVFYLNRQSSGEFKTPIKLERTVTIQKP